MKKVTATYTAEYDNNITASANCVVDIDEQRLVSVEPIHLEDDATEIKKEYITLPDGFVWLNWDI